MGHCDLYEEDIPLTPMLTDTRARAGNQNNEFLIYAKNKLTVLSSPKGQELRWESSIQHNE